MNKGIGLQSPSNRKAAKKTEHATEMLGHLQTLSQVEPCSSALCLASAKVLINTWEALYFQVYHERVMELARPVGRSGVAARPEPLRKRSAVTPSGSWGVWWRVMGEGCGPGTRVLCDVDITAGILTEPGTRRRSAVWLKRALLSVA